MQPAEEVLVKNAINILSDEGKAPGCDSASEKEINATGEVVINVTHKVCNKVLEIETFPEDG